MDSTDVAIQNVLEHHGIKGMKWGVRTAGRSGSSKAEVTVKTRSNPQIKTIVRTKGGKGLPAHPDAVSARIVRQKLKKSGMTALSNKELQDHNTRFQLEQNAARLTPPSTIARGLQHVTSFLKTPQGQEAAAQGISVLSKKRLAKGAAKVAVTTAAMAL